jgi:hypothetical protein
MFRSVFKQLTVFCRTPLYTLTRFRLIKKFSVLSETRAKTWALKSEPNKSLSWYGQWKEYRNSVSLKCSAVRKPTSPGAVLHVRKEEMSQEIIKLLICIYLLFGQLWTHRSAFVTWRWAVSFWLRPLYPGLISTRYPLDRRQGELQSPRSSHVGRL